MKPVQYAIAVRYRWKTAQICGGIYSIAIFGGGGVIYGLSTLLYAQLCAGHLWAIALYAISGVCVLPLILLGGAYFRKKSRLPRAVSLTLTSLVALSYAVAVVGLVGSIVWMASTIPNFCNLPDSYEIATWEWVMPMVGALSILVCFFAVLMMCAVLFFSVKPKDQN